MSIGFVKIYTLLIADILYRRLYILHLLLKDLLKRLIVF